MNHIKGKIIAITGASSGIGRTFACLAADHGATPVLLARTAHALQELKEDLAPKSPQTGSYRLDVTDEQQVCSVVEEIIAAYGQIDIWINNAGYGIFSAFTEADLNDFTGMMDVNYMGTVRCIKAVLPHMLRRNTGHIVNVASVAGKLPTPKSSGYSATKFAVLGFTNSLRQELNGTGVNISSVNPGPVHTAFFERADTNGEYRRNIEKFMLTPEKVAQAMLDAIETNKAEITVPRYMKLGILVHQLFPSLFNRIIVPRINKK
ncbi:SDR family oxidoreductase [Aneurinibacillus terranovensis]|uniref:SDR family oxidoreductase n=1 Tax=Aneurinibacillus terranovensis TaxID=278991 RepID=UPI0003FACD54|nr:SDR family oxidoreductase [Aneurinibacillus terranovensis]